MQKNSDSLTLTYTELSWEASYSGYNQEAIAYAQEAIQLAKKQANNLNLASAWNALASAYDELSDFKQAEKYFRLSLAYFHKHKNVKREASTLNNLGTIYFNQSNYKLALDCFFKALHIKEKINDSTGIANCYTNMANVYYELQQFTKAKDLLVQATGIYRKMGDREGLAGALSNLGGIYAQQEQYKNAFKAQHEALRIYANMHIPEGLSSCYSNVAYYYKCLKQYDSALVYYEKSAQIALQIGDKLGYAGTLLSKGDVYYMQKKYTKTLALLQESEKLYHEMNTVEGLVGLYTNLANTYYELGDYKNAMDYQRKTVKIKDSLFSIENSKVLSDLKTTYAVEKKAAELKAVAKAEKEKLALQASKHRQKQQLILYAVAGGLFISIVFSFFIFKGLQRNKRANKIIAYQKQEVEEKKHLIEEKQKEINDSINYAKRIQQSFLTADTDFKKNLHAYFIYFQPKDVVSGDFYWAHIEEHKTFVCIADSTGHGIPGAFMSLLNISLLNEAVLSRNLRASHEILNFVRSILVLGLKSDATGQGGNDGMDCVFFVLNHQTMMLEFCGANNPLWIAREGKMIELQPQKMPVGRSPVQHISFESVLFQLQKGDRIYAFSDGYADQFGGEKGKKFKYANMEKLLLESANTNMETTKHVLETRFNAWKGKMDQVDDICIMGIEV